MGDVIKGPWEMPKKKPVSTTEDFKIKHEALIAVEPILDREFYLASPEAIHAANEKISELATYQLKLPPVNPYASSSGERTRGFAAHTLEDLCDMMSKSGESDWAKTPAFYVAIAEEIQARLEHLQRQTG